ncbi:MAG: peptide deformylase [Rhodospirillales bacterium]|nr:peptide deformylase [Rhodospirillales bacterium]
MARLPIIVAPDPRLKKASAPVEAVDDEICALLDDMLETMYDANGVGLAAPQVGVLKRVVVIDVARADETSTPMELVNPEVVWVSDDIVVKEEGCLSLPEYYAEVERPETIRVTYLDRVNKKQELEADEMLATCIQHEIDHLDGVLFVDHVSSLKRNMILRKLNKAKRQGSITVA